MTDVTRGTRVPFVSECPTCGLLQAQWHTHSALSRLLQRGHAVEAYCAVCDAYWPIGGHERDSLTAKLTG